MLRRPVRRRGRLVWWERWLLAALRLTFRIERGWQRRQQRRRPEALLLGLFFTEDGERYQPSHTQKANGKSYRYYVPILKLRFGAEASEAGRAPAEPIEQLVLAQVHAVLKAPEAVQAGWDTVRAQHPEISEPEVVLQSREIGAVWEHLFPEERRRIVLIKPSRAFRGGRQHGHLVDFHRPSSTLKYITRAQCHECRTVGYRRGCRPAPGRGQGHRLPLARAQGAARASGWAAVEIPAFRGG